MSTSELIITVLGCGNSTGVPSIGNYWGQCDPSEPKNRRTRASVAVQSAQTTLIVDTGPDFHNQMNREDIRNLDAALYTHFHEDHVNGIHELRAFSYRNKNLTPIYADNATLATLHERFKFLFEGGGLEIYPPVIKPHTLEYGQTYTIGDITFDCFEQDHGSCSAVGYRFGDFGYSTDILDLNEAAINALKGIKTWIVDGCGYHRKNPVAHANLKTLYRLNEQIGAKEIYLTSLSLHMDYQTLLSELPEGYKPAYDGLRLKCTL
ncbi:MAG: MBL fold metallo-hydrolase [Rhodospirillales bacterium]|nr:MBL fold metallo-hydrolase [Rhodospirillales bacterium]